MSTIIHLVRHGRILDYKTDQSLTELGRQEALTAGRELAAQVKPGETIRFFSSPSRRARETAALLRDGLGETLPQHTPPAVLEPTIAVDDYLQDLKFYLDGASYAPITPLLEIARWRLQQNPSPEIQTFVEYQHEFWTDPDPVGYWLTHPSPVVESPEAVMQRTLAFLAERLAENSANNKLRREVCVTHSPILRIFLQLTFGQTFGPPPFSGMLTIKASQIHYQGQVADLPVL